MANRLLRYSSTTKSRVSVFCRLENCTGFVYFAHIMSYLRKRNIALPFIFKYFLSFHYDLHTRIYPFVGICQHMLSASARRLKLRADVRIIMLSTCLYHRIKLMHSVHTRILY